MSARNVALLRGINVGTAKSISMAELKAVFESLDLDDVQTVLRSGNVVFSGEATAAVIERAVRAATGVQSSVLVLSAASFRLIAHSNPLVESFSDGSKGFVTYLSKPPGRIEVPDAETLAPELLAVSGDAIYQWMPDGSLQTKVPKWFWKQFAGHVTARNWNTVKRLLTLLDDERRFPSCTGRAEVHLRP